MEKRKITDFILKVLLLLIAIVPLLYFNKVENVPLKAFILGTGSWGFGLIFKMIAHQLIVVKIQRKKISNMIVALTNGFLSGIFELSAALAIILLMLEKFDFNYNAIICFGLAIGSLESVVVGFSSSNSLLKGTALEESSGKITQFIESIQGNKFYLYHLFLPVFERVLSTFIHIATRGLIFVSLINGSIFPFLIAMTTFIIADGILGYYYNISGRLLNHKGIRELYIYLTLLTIVVTALFFILINPYQDFTL